VKDAKRGIMGFRFYGQKMQLLAMQADKNGE
jgi:hypothetical protein